MRLSKKTFIWMGLVTAVVALTLLSGSPVLAATDKDVTVVNTQSNPVPVTGTVEVLNDALYQPYIQLNSVDITDGNLLGEVLFDVPDGKRLILETLSVQVAVPEGQKVRVTLNAQVKPASPDKYFLGFVPVQSPGPILGVEYYIANQPFKLRQDWFSGSNSEITVNVLRDSSIGRATLLVTLYGHLVDSPSQGLGL